MVGDPPRPRPAGLRLSRALRPLLRAGWTDIRRAPPRHPHPDHALLRDHGRRDRRARPPRCPPADQGGGEHRHPPPDGRHQALPAGLRARRPFLCRRLPRGAGRRRGVRYGNRMSDVLLTPVWSGERRPAAAMELSLPDAPKTLQPRSDAAGYHAVCALGPDLMENARDSVRDTIAWLQADHSLSREDAYILCSLAGDLRISQIVDQPNFGVSFYLPLTVFN